MCVCCHFSFDCVDRRVNHVGADLSHAAVFPHTVFENLCLSWRQLKGDVKGAAEFFRPNVWGLWIQQMSHLVVISGLKCGLSQTLCHWQHRTKFFWPSYTLTVIVQIYIQYLCFGFRLYRAWSNLWLSFLSARPQTTPNGRTLCRKVSTLLKNKSRGNPLYPSLSRIQDPLRVLR